MEEEDLADNDFYIMLQQRFKGIYKKAAAKCFIFCIPRRSSLQNFAYTAENMEAHLLRESPYTIGQYVTMNERIVELVVGEGGKQFVRLIEGAGWEHGDMIPIMFEVEFYNDNYEGFRVLCLRSPLSGGSGVVVDLEARAAKFNFPTTHSREGYVKFLLDLEGCYPVLERLLKEVSDFNTSYNIYRSNTTRTRDKLASVIVPAKHSIVQLRRDLNEACRTRKNDECVLRAVESFVLGGVYFKIFQALKEEKAREDVTVLHRLQELSSTTLAQLGVPVACRCSLTRAVAVLSRLDDVHTPLEKLECLADANAAISEEVAANPEAASFVPLSTDDLLPLLLSVIIRTALPFIASNIVYMESFQICDMSATSLGFALTTFKAAVEYLLSGDFQLAPSTPPVFSSNGTAPGLAALAFSPSSPLPGPNRRLRSSGSGTDTTGTRRPSITSTPTATTTPRQTFPDIPTTGAPAPIGVPVAVAPASAVGNRPGTVSGAMAVGGGAVGGGAIGGGAMVGGGEDGLAPMLSNRTRTVVDADGFVMVMPVTEVRPVFSIADNVAPPQHQPQGAASQAPGQTAVQQTAAPLVGPEKAPKPEMVRPPRTSSLSAGTEVTTTTAPPPVAAPAEPARDPLMGVTPPVRVTRVGEAEPRATAESGFLPPPQTPVRVAVPASPPKDRRTLIAELLDQTSDTPPRPSAGGAGDAQTVAEESAAGTGAIASVAVAQQDGVVAAATEGAGTDAGAVKTDVGVDTTRGGDATDATRAEHHEPPRPLSLGSLTVREHGAPSPATGGGGGHSAYHTPASMESPRAESPAGGAAEPHDPYATSSNDAIATLMDAMGRHTALPPPSAVEARGEHVISTTEANPAAPEEKRPLSPIAAALQAGKIFGSGSPAPVHDTLSSMPPATTPPLGRPTHSVADHHHVDHHHVGGHSPTFVGREPWRTNPITIPGKEGVVAAHVESHGDLDLLAWQREVRRLERQLQEVSQERDEAHAHLAAARQKAAQDAYDHAQHVEAFSEEVARLSRIVDAVCGERDRALNEVRRMQQQMRNEPGAPGGEERAWAAAREAEAELTKVRARMQALEVELRDTKKALTDERAAHARTKKSNAKLQLTVNQSSFGDKSGTTAGLLGRFS